MTSSRFHGVAKDGPRWIAKISFNSKPHYLGCFAVEEDAARAYDTKARQLGVDPRYFNFPAGPRPDGPPPVRKKNEPLGPVGLRGVSRKKSGRFLASFWTGSKNVTAYHDTAEAAARWWDNKARRSGRPEAGLNFPRGGQPNAVALAAPSAPPSHEQQPAKRRRQAAAERGSGGQASEEAGASERMRELLEAAKLAESADRRVRRRAG